MDRRLLTSLLSVAAVLLSVAQGSPFEDLTKVTALEDTKAAENRESPDLQKSEQTTSPGAKLQVHFPSEDIKQVVASKEEDDSIRAPRQSPTMSFGHGPHTTTVCIQVRSDHHRPEVMCGPQVMEEKKEPAAARFAVPEYYARATPQYPARYAQQQLPSAVPMMPPPTQARVPIYPATRREQEVTRPVEHLPAQAPLRVLNRQFYQPQLNYPFTTASLYPQMRLSCGVQPDGGQLFNSPLLRSSPMLVGYYPVGEQVVTLQDGSSAILAPSEPLRARMSSDYLNQESPYAAYSAAYPVDSGFYAMDMQGRAADSGFDQSYSNSMGYPSESSLDEATRSLLQQQELQQSQQRLRMLQDQLRMLHQRADAEEALKSDIPQDQDVSPPQQKKEQTSRSSKRNARTKEI